MRSVAAAIFTKQLQDILKNKEVLIGFIMFPGIAFVMINLDIAGVSNLFFTSIFASMFIGMTLINTTAIAIAEDRGKKSLRFLMMAGVKPHQYLTGMGGVYLVCAIVVGSLFAMMIPGLSLLHRLLMLSSLTLGAVASIIFGAILGMLSKNEQTASSLSMSVGIIIGFGPMIAVYNETVRKIFRVFYTMNFIYNDFYAGDITRRIAIILINIAVLAVVFAWVYKKRGALKV